ncbi:zonadhesin [Trichonephila clavata]|uniref:Zonadhesin n=1 Tax=Trichonephila clavata TaxID=2740835 RepID=A0A8X6K5V7_TRICU|nr:zonadhesin [Trichonephila clavata]
MITKNFADAVSQIHVLMKLTLTNVLLIAIRSVAFATRAHECPEHEHWVLCEAHCQKNCTNYKQNLPCTKNCVAGCVCDRGYVRGLNGKCIRRDKCPKVSGWDSISETEEPPTGEDHHFELRERCRNHYKFDECGAHPLCQKNCQNYNENFPCPSICMPGCICEDGYVEGPNKECIKKEECRHYSEDKKCPKNSKYVECGAYPLCQKTCENYDKLIPCPAVCVPGCVCEEGFVKGPDGECIPIHECPHKSEAHGCPEHEHWNLCEAHCQKNCTNYKQTLPCNKRCVAGCVCDRGYVRGLNGKCILKEKCPMETERTDTKRACPPREHISRCMGHCQKTCESYLKPKPCPRKCQKGCVCDGGLVRGPRGRCIMPSKCPAILDMEETV